MKILMVCLGNICRSPLAEGILRKKVASAGARWEVDSAGTEYDHAGDAPHPLSQKTALQHSIDISGLRARRFIREDFDRFDKIYAMATDVYEEIQSIGGPRAQMDKVALLMDEVSPGKNLSVPDPWYGPESGYQKVYAMLDKACDRIIEKYFMEKIARQPSSEEQPAGK